MNHINYSVTCSLIADYERSVFLAGYFSYFMSARTVESRPNMSEESEESKPKTSAQL